MQKENGNNTYKEKDLIKFLEQSKYYYQQGNFSLLNDYLMVANNIIKETKDINNILRLEAICLDIYDTNFIENNIDKISNKLVACRTAIKENTLFENNKEEYLADYTASRIKDITKDSAFEKSTKELVRYLGIEKRSLLINKDIYNFLEVRQDKVKEISQEFRKERISFLQKHIKQEVKQDITNFKEKNNTLER